MIILKSGAVLIAIIAGILLAGVLLVAIWVMLPEARQYYRLAFTSCKQAVFPSRSTAKLA